MIWFKWTREVGRKTDQVLWLAGEHCGDGAQRVACHQGRHNRRRATVVHWTRSASPERCTRSERRRTAATTTTATTIRRKISQTLSIELLSIKSDH